MRGQRQIDFQFGCALTPALRRHSIAACWRRARPDSSGRTAPAFWISQRCRSRIAADGSAGLFQRAHHLWIR